MTRIWNAVALLAVALALTAGPVIAAVPQEAYTRIAFVDGCSGHGYLFTWDAVLYPDPTKVPEWKSGGFHEVTWGPSEPITQPMGGPDILEEGRYGFALLDSSRQTILFRALYGVQFEPRRFVLDVTLDCSTIPYTIVALGDTAMERRATPTRSAFVVVVGIGCLAASLALALRTRLARRR